MNFTINLTPQEFEDAKMMAIQNKKRSVQEFIQETVRTIVNSEAAYIILSPPPPIETLEEIKKHINKALNKGRTMIFVNDRGTWL